MLFLIGTDVYSYLIVSFVKVIRSDQGGSRNLFSENANTSFHVTLVFDDSEHFRAHKGSNHKSYKMREQPEF